MNDAERMPTGEAVRVLRDAASAADRLLRAFAQAGDVMMAYHLTESAIPEAEVRRERAVRAAVAAEATLAETEAAVATRRAELERELRSVEARASAQLAAMETELSLARQRVVQAVEEADRKILEVSTGRDAVIAALGRDEADAREVHSQVLATLAEDRRRAEEALAALRTEQDRFLSEIARIQAPQL